MTKAETKDFAERQAIAMRLRKYRSKLCEEQAEKQLYCKNCSAEVDHSRCCISMVLRVLGG